MNAKNLEIPVCVLLSALLLAACTEPLGRTPLNDLGSQIVNGTVSKVGSRPYQVKLDILAPHG